MTAKKWMAIFVPVLLVLGSCSPQNQEGPKAENPYTLSATRCGEDPTTMRPSGDNTTLRVIVDVLEHCGHGVLVEQQGPNNTWNDIFGPNLMPDQERPLEQTGKNIFYGELAGALRVRCVEGTEDSCIFKWKVNTIARSSQNVLIHDTVSQMCGDNKPLVVKFNGLRRDGYTATVKVLSDCGNGVKVQRYQHQRAGVTYNNDAAETVPPAPNTEFMVNSGQQARWTVKSTNTGNNVCWFIVTCIAGAGGQECKFTIDVTDPTVQQQ